MVILSFLLCACARAHVFVCVHVLFLSPPQNCISTHTCEFVPSYARKKVSIGSRWTIHIFSVWAFSHYTTIATTTRTVTRLCTTLFLCLISSRPHQAIVHIKFSPSINWPVYRAHTLSLSLSISHRVQIKWLKNYRLLFTCCISISQYEGEAADQRVETKSSSSSL